MTFKSSEASEINMTILMTPSHSNFSGKIHGGYILNLMDQVAFSCASKHSGNYCVTASVNRVDFIHPIEVGELVHLKASINYTGNTSMVVGVRVESENIRTGQINHCNSSYFTMVAKDDSGKNVKVPGLELKTKNDIRKFVRNIHRMAETNDRQSEFDAAVFDPQPYMNDLENQNANCLFEL